uniref:Nanos-type domain-containing protein n=1 Tax=Panagrolaimus sp. ES5 TaxID=591445 RepID=A0AC34FA95_9BILA
MHTPNQPPNVGLRQVQYGGPPRQPFIPGPPQGMIYTQPPRVQNPAYFNQAPPHYTQLPQVNPGGSISDSATSPPSVASTPGLAAIPTNNGNPLQPDPPVYYSLQQQQQQQQHQRFIPPPPPPPQQYVYVQIPQQGGPRGRPQFNQRPQAIMQYQHLPPNFNMNQRFPVPFNPQGVMPPPNVGQFFDPSMQQQQPQQQNFQKPGYQGKNRRGGGNSNQQSRRGSIRPDGRPDSSNRPSSQPSPDPQLPQFAEQNVQIQQGQIMQQNPMYAFPPSLLQQGPQQYYIPQQFSQEPQMGQQVYVLQGDPNAYNQPNQYYQNVYVVPQQHMQQQQQQQQLMHMDPQHQHFMPPPPQPPQNAELDVGAMVQAIEQLKLQEKEHHQNSPERIESAAVPALDAVSVQGDEEDYTPAGTPQSLNPLDAQQMDKLLDAINLDDQKSKEEIAFEKEDSRRQEAQRKRHQKPEQQHYQPPQRGRGNGQRGGNAQAWRGNQQPPAAQMTKIFEEKPKATYPTAPIIFEPSKPTSLPSDTPTPRASPTPPPKAKEVVADVPMIGGVPLVPMIGGKPLVASNAILKSESLNEHCTFCEQEGKPRHIITNHSTFSKNGIPACPALREEGCKICGGKGDSAHLERFCKKTSNKENNDFKNMANHIMNMSPNDKGAILIKDMQKHPTVQQIQSNPDEEFQKEIDNGRRRVFTYQNNFKKQDRQEYEQYQAQQQHNHAMGQQRQYHDDRQYRDERQFRDDRHYRGGDERQYRGGRGSRDGGGGRGSGGRGNRYRGNRF